jgi:hypothetical protein
MSQSYSMEQERPASIVYAFLVKERMANVTPVKLLHLTHIVYKHQKSKSKEMNHTFILHPHLIF